MIVLINFSIGLFRSPDLEGISLQESYFIQESCSNVADTFEVAGGFQMACCFVRRVIFLLLTTVKIINIFKLVQILV